MAKQQVLVFKLNKWIIKGAVMRHLLDTTEFNKEELETLIALGRDMKAKPADYRTGLAGKNIVTLFENSRCVPV